VWSVSTAIDGLMKPAEVSKLLAVSRSWVYDAAADGRIPAIRLGGPEGPLRFVRADLEVWLQEQRASWMPGRR
jgi:excisionase family DNA binding protein